MQRSAAIHPELFANAPETAEGFGYWPEIVSAPEERAWVERFAALPLKPFEFHGYRGKRRVLSFGWRYDYAGHALRPSVPMPGFLEPMRQRAAAVAGLDGQHLQQALVTEYEQGVTIGWHRDRPMFEDVVALSFGSACRLRLRRRHGTRWERWSTDIAPRSLYRLSGPARHQWEHSIPPVPALRYSVTFRTFVGDFGALVADAKAIQTGA
jgi:alkylated DNA repair dioxygenase AlkB